MSRRWSSSTETMLSNKNNGNKRQPAKWQVVFVFLLFLFLAVLLGFYRCPLVFLIGLPCPLCGITRAFIALFSGNIIEAFYYHPLWPLILLSIILYILYSLNIIRPGKRIFNIACILLAIALLVCYFFRIKSGSPVVRFDPDSSLIGRLFIK